MAASLPTTPSPQLYVGGGQAKPTAKVRLVHLATGAIHEAWPIDAREHVAAGDFVTEEQYLAEQAAAANAVTEETANEQTETETAETPSESDASDASPTGRRRR